MSRWLAKLLALIIVFVIVLTSTLVPIKVSKIFARQGQRGVRIVSLLMCFGGGVFLGVYALHMAPDARFAIEESIIRPNNMDYPLADLIIIIGFFMMLFVETLVDKCTGGAGDAHHHGNVQPDAQSMVTLVDHGSSHSVLEGNTGSRMRGARAVDYQASLSQLRLNSSSNNMNSSTEKYDLATTTNGNAQRDWRMILDPSDATSTPLVPLRSKGTTNGQCLHHGPTPLRTTLSAGGYCFKDGLLVPIHHQHKVTLLPDGKTTIISDVDWINCHPFDGSLCRRHSALAYRAELAGRVATVGIDPESDGGGPGRRVSVAVDPMQVTRSLVLLLALSLHHVFEGIGIGLKETVAAVWSMCAAIIAHEIIIAFSLGMQLVRSYKRLKHVIIAAVICSVMSPLGVLIGIALTETGSEKSQTMAIVNGVLKCLATGVFIYVTFFEILQRELGCQPSFLKLLFVVVGFTTLALMALIPGDMPPMTEEMTQDPIVFNCSLCAGCSLVQNSSSTWM